ncbi:hypothetical protein [Schlesneria sp. DSM 10557]|uniref:bleomycin resistance protein n=1 Tax=Schlesneria sp. DSM 10557 TaxID=3044399 RepID=UPI0035A1AFDD
MANERMYPILPCRDIDEAIEFYAVLGFVKTYRQVRPNPYAVVVRDGMHIHLFGMAGFDPERSYGSVIICVPDPDELYRSFAEGLRSAYKKLPISGIPRIVRPRKRFGTVYGFSVVDVGGNWLRISRLGETEEDAEIDEKSVKDLSHFLDLAARLADAHGDDRKAYRTLETGLKRFPDAPPFARARALIYHAELAARLKKSAAASRSLATVQSLILSDKERMELADEIAETSALVNDM